MRSEAADIIADLHHRVAELERRVQNKDRDGTIHEVDAGKKVARVLLSTDPTTGKPYLTPWIPWEAPAMGGVKVNIPPTVGEQVTVRSESGDMTDGVIGNSTKSNANPMPDAQPGEGIVIADGVKIFWQPNKIVLEAADILLKGTVMVDGDMNQTGVHIDRNGPH